MLRHWPGDAAAQNRKWKPSVMPSGSSTILRKLPAIRPGSGCGNCRTGDCVTISSSLRGRRRSPWRRCPSSSRATAARGGLASSNASTEAVLSPEGYLTVSRDSGRGMAVLPNGTLVRPVWPPEDEKQIRLRRALDRRRQDLGREDLLPAGGGISNLADAHPSAPRRPAGACLPAAGSGAISKTAPAPCRT